MDGAQAKSTTLTTPRNPTCIPRTATERSSKTTLLMTISRFALFAHFVVYADGDHLVGI